ncbi:MAG: lipid-A-disaccharide synthase [Planctomycetota bacterium]|jgi:lipid-A-disaccharide synthase
MTRPLRIFVSAGEESGDRHGAELTRALKALEPSCEIRGVGGKRMAQAGCEIHHDPLGIAVMWFVDVFKNLRTFVRMFENTVRIMGNWKPDVLVPIDYPGFNLRLADRAKGMDIPVAYYISPQVWAWFPGRVHRIAEVVDKMIVIFPFETGFYEDAGVEASYVGHPLGDRFGNPETAPRNEPDEQLVALLPGSRRSEVKRNLPVMLDAAARLTETRPLKFASAFNRRGLAEIAEDLARDFPHPFSVITSEGAPGGHDGVTELMRSSRLALVCAGSATVELAYVGTPMVVLYKVALPSYLLYLLLNRSPHIAMVNLLAGKGAVPEFLQWRHQPERLVRAARPLLENREVREAQSSALARIRSSLGGPGASTRAAKLVLDLARKQRSRVTNLWGP